MVSNGNKPEQPLDTTSRAFFYTTSNARCNNVTEARSQSFPALIIFNNCPFEYHLPPEDEGRQKIYLSCSFVSIPNLKYNNKTRKTKKSKNIMKLRTYIIALVLSTALCIVAWVITLQYINPEQAGILGLILFYASFFVSIIGIAALMGLYIRILFSRNEILFAHITPSFRQGVLVAACATILLFLQGTKLLTWWDALLVVLIISLTEFFFHSRELSKKEAKIANEL